MSLNEWPLHEQVLVLKSPNLIFGLAPYSAARTWWIGNSAKYWFHHIQHIKQCVISEYKQSNRTHIIFGNF